LVINTVHGLYKDRFHYICFLCVTVGDFSLVM
jgi:hypothetical protein